MRNDGQKPQGGVPRSGRSNGFLPSSFRTITGYLKIVSSGASTVASAIQSAGASVASSIVDRGADDGHDQVRWAGFDKLQSEGDAIRQVLLLGYRSGFQVWDVEEADNVHELASTQDGPVSLLQMQPKPIASKRLEDKFAEVRPLLVVAADGSCSGSGNVKDGSTPHCNLANCHDTENANLMTTIVQFYSLRSQSYVHVLKFRSSVYCIRCSPRVVAISQAAQIHCFDAATLEKQYMILTNPIVPGSLDSGNIGYGPLAVASRWLAYSGSPVVASISSRVSPEHLTSATSFAGTASSGNMVAYYAKESSKQLAAGVVNLGAVGHKKLSRYCSDLLPDRNNSQKAGSSRCKSNGNINGHFPAAENVGMVIVRDIIDKSVIAQFRAHKSPISALCFDPSGTLLVTASVQGHNINVFRIMPVLHGRSSGSDDAASYAHLYRLQRGFTNAVIQDISFSEDSQWIMISSSRGTNHLFAISPSGGSVNLQATDASFTFKGNGLGLMTKPTAHREPCAVPLMLNQQSICASGPPVTLSVVSRIKNGNSGWRGAVNGAAAVATGKLGSFSGVIASSFHNSRGNDLYVADTRSLRTKYHLLVFSPSGCVIQYMLFFSTVSDAGMVVPQAGSLYDSAPDSDVRLVVEAIQKWDVCQRQNRREREDNVDIYGEHGNADSVKIYPEEMRRGTCVDPVNRGSVTKAKINPEEKNHLYISEAELISHHARIPLWEKSEIYFQLMMVNSIKERGYTLEGEIEIEKIPSRMIEARSKDLVPVIDYFQTPKFQQTRMPASDGNQNGTLRDSRVPCSSSSSSLDHMPNGCASVAEICCGIEENGWGSLQMSAELTKDFVNINDSAKMRTQLDIVNNRESSKVGTDIMCVYNNKESLKMENLI